MNWLESIKHSTRQLFCKFNLSISNQCNLTVTLELLLLITFHWNYITMWSQDHILLTKLRIWSKVWLKMEKKINSWSYCFTSERRFIYNTVHSWFFIHLLTSWYMQQQHQSDITVNVEILTVAITWNKGRKMVNDVQQMTQTWLVSL